MPKSVNALTVDVEDWYQGIEIEPKYWNDFESRIEFSLCRLLSLLSERDVRATFFVLGWIAEHKPDLVKKIADSGHEIGTHGYSHRLIYRQGPEAFTEDLRRSIALLEDLTGNPVTAHRAPFFSITRDSLWALDILLRNGIRIDSSIFPVRNYRYGLPDAPRHPYRYENNGSSLVEFPISTLRICGRNMPFAGGFYLRFWPYYLLNRALQAFRQEGSPAVVYIHPWEIDTEHPRLRLPYRIGLPHYFNLKSTKDKLRRMLEEFPFAPLGSVVTEIGL